jgi:hypothetical protein
MRYLAKNLFVEAVLGLQPQHENGFDKAKHGMLI